MITAADLDTAFKDTRTLLEESTDGERAGAEALMVKAGMESDVIELLYDRFGPRYAIPVMAGVVVGAICARQDLLKDLDEIKVSE